MMKQEDLFKKIGVILNELQNQYDYLALHPMQMNELEISLFQANADFLSNHVKIFMKANQAVQQENIKEPDEPDAPEEEAIPALEVEAAPVPVDEPAAAFEFIIEQDEDEPDTEPEPEETKFEFEEKPVAALYNRPLSDEEQHILAEKARLRQVVEPVEEEEEVGPEPFLIVKEEAAPVPVMEVPVSAPVDVPVEVPADIPVMTPAAKEPAQKPTLNDLLAARNEKSSTADALHKPKISDLKQAISLNDKLLYIKDLFNGYNLAYSEAIELANKLPDFEAADNFFKKNYALQNNWADKQETVDKFYALLNQRFSTN